MSVYVDEMLVFAIVFAYCLLIVWIARNGENF